MAHEAGEAARAVAALARLAAVGVEYAVAEVRVRAARWLDQQHLVAADAEAPVGDARMSRGRSLMRWLIVSIITKSLPAPCILVNLTGMAYVIVPL
jgi:hypothetical protein